MWVAITSSCESRREMCSLTPQDCTSYSILTWTGRSFWWQCSRFNAVTPELPVLLGWKLVMGHFIRLWCKIFCDIVDSVFPVFVVSSIYMGNSQILKLCHYAENSIYNCFSLKPTNGKFLLLLDLFKLTEALKSKSSWMLRLCGHQPSVTMSK